MALVSRWPPLFPARAARGGGGGGRGGGAAGAAAPPFAVHYCLLRPVSEGACGSPGVAPTPSHLLQVLSETLPGGPGNSVPWLRPASPVPSRKRTNLQEETGTGSSAKKARQDQDLHPHVSTDAAPADLKNGSDDGDSRAGSTEDSTGVATHVDAIIFSDSNCDHGLGQVLGAWLLATCRALPESALVRGFAQTQ
jgi:hypothetical protein